MKSITKTNLSQKYFTSELPRYFGAFLLSRFSKKIKSWHLSQLKELDAPISFFFWNINATQFKGESWWLRYNVLRGISSIGMVAYTCLMLIYKWKVTWKDKGTLRHACWIGGDRQEGQWVKMAWDETIDEDEQGGHFSRMAFKRGHQANH